MDFADKRKEMVERQIQARGITNQRLIAALLSVPRELFVPPALAEAAYTDKPLPIEEGQTISQPYILALMIDLLQPQPHEKVLEVGAGSGYAAAVLGQLAQKVYAVELKERLALKAAKRIEKLGLANVNIICADGSDGWPDYAPYDAILLSASAVTVPPRLKQQLAANGRLILPLGEPYQKQDLIYILRRDAQEFVSYTVGEVTFLPLAVGGPEHHPQP